MIDDKIGSYTELFPVSMSKKHKPACPPLPINLHRHEDLFLSVLINKLMEIIGWYAKSTLYGKL
jgi:hypothetical protein